MLRPLFLLICPLLFVSTIPAAELTAQALVQRSLAARGGADKFAAVHSLRIHGTLQGSGILVIARRPSFFRVEVNTPNGLVVEAFDGTKGWSRPPGIAAAELSGAQLADLQDQAANAIGGVLVDAAQRGNKIELEGREQREGRNCYVLRVKMPGGRVIHEYLDPVTFLSVHEKLEDGGGKPPIEETIGDYKRFGGILFPCRFVSGTAADAEKQTLLVEKMEINPLLDEKIFVIPTAR